MSSLFQWIIVMKNKSLLVLLFFCLVCIIGLWWSFTHQTVTRGCGRPLTPLPLIWSFPALVSYFLAAILFVGWLFHVIATLIKQKKFSVQEIVKEKMIYFYCALLFLCLPCFLSYAMPYKTVYVVRLSDADRDRCAQL